MNHTHIIRRHQQQWVKHHERIDAPSIQKYARVLTKCIAFALAIHLHEHPACVHYDFPIPEPIRNTLQQLKSDYHLEAPPPVDLEPDTSATDIDPTDFDDEGEHYVAPKHRRKKKAHGFAPASPIIQPLLSAVVESIFTQLPPQDYSNTLPFFSVVVRFLILSCLTEKGDFCSSTIATQTIAALTFSGRVTMHNLLLRALDENPNADRSMYVHCFYSILFY